MQKNSSDGARSPEGAVGFYAIGDPGRAARETPAGPPPAAVGPSDVELSSASLSGMQIRAASSRGLQHRAEHTLRQDAFALGQRTVDGSERQAVAVVCDGVGSLERSDYAAALASRRLAERAVAGMCWPDAFGYVNEELGKAAVEMEAAGCGGLATTAVALSVGLSSGVWAGEVAWVGDSTLWHLGDDLTWRLIIGPGAGEGARGYHSSAVRPMPSADGSCAWCSFRLRGGALFAMTDGVSNPLSWSGEVRAALAGWWASPPDPFTFAAQVGFAKKTHIDDRTVVGIWPDGDGGDASQEAGTRRAGRTG
jgi:Protein phosphatase 2C